MDVKLKFRLRINGIDYPAFRYGYVKHKPPFVFGFNVRPNLDVDAFLYDKENDRWFVCNPAEVMRAIASDTMVKGAFVPVPHDDLRLRLVRNHTKLYRITAPYWMTAETLSAFGWIALDEVDAEYYHFGPDLFVPTRLVFLLKNTTFANAFFPIEVDTSWLDIGSDGFYGPAPYLDMMRPDVNDFSCALDMPPMMRARVTIADLIESGGMRDALTVMRPSLAGKEPAGIDTFRMPHATVAYDGTTVVVVNRGNAWTSRGRTLAEALDALNTRTTWPAMRMREWIEADADGYVAYARLCHYGTITDPLIDAIDCAIPRRRTVFASDAPPSPLFFDIEKNEFGLDFKI